MVNTATKETIQMFTCASSFQAASQGKAEVWDMPSRDKEINMLTLSLSVLIFSTIFRTRRRRAGTRRPPRRTLTIGLLKSLSYLLVLCACRFFAKHQRLVDRLVHVFSRLEQVCKRSRRIVGNPDQRIGENRNISRYPSL